MKLRLWVITDAAYPDLTMRLEKERRYGPVPVELKPGLESIELRMKNPELKRLKDRI